MRAAGYRPKKLGGHYNTFAALKAADAKVFQLDADYFQICRMRRNDSEYSMAGGISSSDADELVQAAIEFEKTVERWIWAHYPVLQK